MSMNLVLYVGHNGCAHVHMRVALVMLVCFSRVHMSVPVGFDILARDDVR